jgi:hypothetical protein
VEKEMKPENEVVSQGAIAEAYWRAKIANEIEAEHKKLCVKQDGISYCTHLESAYIARGK